MDNEGAQQPQVGGDILEGVLSFGEQGFGLDGGELGERIVLGVAPDQFDGIECGRIGEQPVTVSMHAAVVLAQPGGAGLVTMDRECHEAELGTVEEVCHQRRKYLSALRAESLSLGAWAVETPHGKIVA